MTQKKGKKAWPRLGICASLMLRIGAVIVAFWALTMVVLTGLMAWAFFENYESMFNETMDQVQRSYHISDYPGSYYEETLEIYDRMPRGCTVGLPFAGETFVASDHCQWSVALVDGEELLMDDGNYLYFVYEPVAPTDGFYVGCSYIDLDESQYGQDLIEKVRSGEESWTHIQWTMDRFMGYFEGGRFHLLEVADYPDGLQDPTALDQVPEQIIVVEEDYGHEGLTMIKPQMVQFHLQQTDPVTVGGTTYGSLEEVLFLYEGIYLADRVEKKGLEESIFVHAMGVEDGDLVIGMQCHPLEDALGVLLPVYIWSSLAVAAVLGLLWWLIRRKLSRPLGELLAQAEDGISVLEPGKGLRWREIGRLEKWYIDAQQEFHELKKENIRLKTALDYAHNAEENRRQMISNITHELKTPLAVIHSYAEGLDEGIAKDKQSHYLDVILEETEQMDAMVLEMLDHSRLEAGKVKLRSDRFSLAKLTLRIIDTFQPLILDRQLQIHFQQLEDVQVTADEARISQVIRNFVTNAMKYTPEGGNIYINVVSNKGKTWFSIENQCEPLSQQALEKLWDTFYRTDESRSAKGTGLGLPIAKSIIDLHGGQCTVENTQDGVIFRFSLP
ncbi:MAG: HAMP domain-containing histidine kinase [Oscillospiraceae bacterium]|nr:HAMP domain-containing histidine kinase [Oscillospiraceae bacterium]